MTTIRMIPDLKYLSYSSTNCRIATQFTLISLLPCTKQRLRLVSHNHRNKKMIKRLD